MLNSRQRSYLRSIAHHINSNIIIGKKGLTDSSFNFINECFEKHELIKVKFKTVNKDDFKDIILKKTNSFIVGSIGKVLILYKPSEEKKIKLPK